MQNKTKFKLCGLTREIDAEYANAVLPDFVGFVFANSKRQVSAKQVETIRAKLVPSIRTVGVFVNESSDAILSLVDNGLLDIAQLQGDESPQEIAYLQQHGVEVWKAFRVQNESDIQQAQASIADKVLLDTYVKDAYGGSGKQFDLTLLASFPPDWINGNVLLAGGLSDSNIAEVLQAVQPYGVDVSSGVETDGLKDYNKIMQFASAVRN